MTQGLGILDGILNEIASVALLPCNDGILNEIPRLSRGMTQGLGNSRFMLKNSRIPRKLCLGILDLRCTLNFTAPQSKTRKKHP